MTDDVSSLVTSASLQAIILALLISVIAPTIMAQITNRSRRADKQQEWERMDAVAAQAKADAALVREGQEKAAGLLIENNKVVAKAAQVAVDAARDTTERLVVIHTLVNSTMTAQMQDNLASVKRERVSLKAQEALLASFAKAIPPELSEAIALAEGKIAELTISLADRTRQQSIVEAQEKAMKGGA